MVDYLVPLPEAVVHAKPERPPLHELGEEAGLAASVQEGERPRYCNGQVPREDREVVRHRRDLLLGPRVHGAQHLLGAAAEWRGRQPEWCDQRAPDDVRGVCPALPGVDAVEDGHPKVENAEDSHELPRPSQLPLDAIHGAEDAEHKSHGSEELQERLAEVLRRLLQPLAREDLVARGADAARARRDGAGTADGEVARQRP
mmetsp:Transcript_87878/g.246806  ORF Transcript_87878/g.246806 Transcript_87878/m.246806 type:complete len:201 (+) Transcript_87878:334-936(+)|eukprot:CAMPEP_0117523194 /NCGR_PEP_ID=MMETSP0784-20121206/34602_1 /TAXON_ID=39447 /ORGANISM="" /LENGTH=200 /DNA_ID=CAMNT_0005319299 /DNA_START=334 /DNA_END=936 /DNA_ORIENTATION=+